MRFLGQMGSRSAGYGTWRGSAPGLSRQVGFLGAAGAGPRKETAFPPGRGSIPSRTQCSLALLLATRLVCGRPRPAEVLPTAPL